MSPQYQSYLSSDALEILHLDLTELTSRSWWAKPISCRAVFERSGPLSTISARHINRAGGSTLLDNFENDVDLNYICVRNNPDAGIMLGPPGRNLRALLFSHSSNDLQLPWIQRP